MGSKSQKTTSQYTSAASPQLQSLIGRAQDVSMQAYNPNAEQQVAPFSADQLAAFNQIRSGLTGDMAQQAAQFANTAGSPISGAAIQSYMNPYQQQVIDATQAQFNTDNARQQSQVVGNSAAQGALGGDRVAVAQALTAEAQQRAQAPVISGLYQQGYQSALNAAQADRTAAAQGVNALGSAANLAYLDPMQQLSSGTLQQQQSQNVLNAASQNAQSQSAYPFLTTQWLASILNPTAGSMGGTSVGTQPGPNLFNTIAGGLSSGVGAWMMSDARVKHDAEKIGEAHDGTPIYEFKYDGDARPQIGFMAQDVERRDPGAVAEIGGIKHVNIARATAPSKAMSTGGGIDGELDDMTAKVKRAAHSLRPFAQGGMASSGAMMPYAGASSYVPVMQVMASQPHMPSMPAYKPDQGPDLSKGAAAIGSYLAKPAAPESVGYGNSWSPIVSDFRPAATGGRIGFADGGDVEWTNDNVPVFNGGAPAEAIPSFAGASDASTPFNPNGGVAQAAPAQSAAPQKAWYEFGANPELGRYLMAAGAGMLQNQSPFFGPGLGTGIQAGLGAWAADKERAVQQQKLQMEKDKFGLEAARNPAQIRSLNAQAKLAEVNSDKEFLLEMEKRKAQYQKELALAQKQAEFDMVQRVMNPNGSAASAVTPGRYKWVPSTPAGQQ